MTSKELQEKHKEQISKMWADRRKRWTAWKQNKQIKSRTGIQGVDQ